MYKTVAKFFSVLSVFAFSAAAYAADEAGQSATMSDRGLLAIAAGFAIAVAALGGALGQGKAAAAALEGIARNPGAADKLFVPMILCVSFIESLVIFSLIISFMLVGKI